MIDTDITKLNLPCCICGEIARCIVETKNYCSCCSPRKETKKKFGRGRVTIIELPPIRPRRIKRDNNFRDD